MKKHLILLILLLFFMIFTLHSSTPVSIKPSGEELNIYVINDIHLLADDLHDNNELFEEVIQNGDGKVLNYTDEILDAFFYEAEQNNVDLVVVNGDLTLNGEQLSHEQLAERFSIFEENTNIEVIVTPGNHDIENPWSRGYVNNDWYKTDTISYNDFSNIYADFGYNQADYKDSNSNSYMYVPSEDVYLLMLDSTIISKNIDTPITNGEIPKDTLEWVEDMGEIAEENGADILIFSHHNILEHDSFSEGMTIDNNEEVFNTLKSINAQVTFSGHSHAQDITSKTEDNYKLYDIVTSSLVITPHSYGSISYQDGVINFETKNVDVEGYAKSLGLTDDNLLDFKTYSRDLFYEITYRRIIEEYKNSDYSEEEISDMSNVVTIAHMADISNSTTDIEDLIKSLDGYDLITSDSTNYYHDYITDLTKSDNKIEDSITINLKKN